MAPDKLKRSVPALKDPALLRMQCYIDGGWRDADDGATAPVVNPATGRHDRHDADVRRGRDAPRDRRCRRRLSRRGARWSRRIAARSCASGTSSCSRMPTTSR